ncbi:MAG: FAD:protein FMN transferase [Chitinispirillales bacterium]|jgi:thiamine biosynthesis lipoprotein|nr:FAD:protein FMN transferase [Chitinispirillales bacterium]
MDTITEITLSVPHGFDTKPIWGAVDSLLSQSEKRFSVTGIDSEVRVLNERNGTAALPVSRELGEILYSGLAYGDTLNGAFDITVLPLKELWGFGEKRGDDETLPDSAQVREAVKAVDYKKVSVNEAKDSIFFESPLTKIDVGGIAKGYILSQLYDLLKSKGINNFLVVAGGDIVVSGEKQDGAPWVIGVQHPRDRNALLATLPLQNGAIVTSGDYERFRIVNGKRYHHIFDPSAGYSCVTNQSLTIWTTDPVKSDIYSTGLFCLSAKEILEFVQARDGIECIVIDSEGKTHISQGWKNSVSNKTFN